jgi:hypothetical protein
MGIILRNLGLRVGPPALVPPRAMDVGSPPLETAPQTHR